MPWRERPLPDMLQDPLNTAADLPHLHRWNSRALMALCSLPRIPSRTVLT